MKRNDFLRGIAGAAALFAANWGTMAQIRLYKQEDKPLLTASNLNRLFTKWEEEKNDGPLKEAATDTRAFLDKYFSISPQQRRTIARMKETDWQNIKAVINDTRQKKGTVDFQFVEKQGEQCQTQLRLVKKELTRQQVKNKPAVEITRTTELKKVIVQ
jgi:hypothetical protein